MLWRTAQLRRDRPSPLDEVRSAMAVFDETLFRLVPATSTARSTTRSRGEAAGPRRRRARAYLRLRELGRRRPRRQPERHRRDHPDGHADPGRPRAAGPGGGHRRVGRALTVAAGYDPALARSCAPSLDRDARATTPTLVAAIAHPLAGRAAPAAAAAARRPHRVAATRHRAAPAWATARRASFLADLRLVQASLAEAGAPRLAYGELQHLIWQAETFGFHLASLEVRQHSRRPRRGAGRALRAAGAHPPTGPSDGRSADAPRRSAWHPASRLRPARRACRRYVVSASPVPPTTSPPSASWPACAVPDGALELDVVPAVRDAAPTWSGPRGARGVPRAPGRRSAGWTPRPAPRGHARLLRLGQGRRLARRQPGALPGPGGAGRLGAPPRHRADAVPRPRRRARPRRRPGQPRRPRPGPRLGRRALQGHRAGRGHLRPLRQPAPSPTATSSRSPTPSCCASTPARGAPRPRPRSASRRWPRPASARPPRRPGASLVEAPGFAELFAG